MHHLFSLPASQTLAEKIRQLSDGTISGIFGRTILNRAYDYVESVEAISIDPGRVVAEVQGTELYEVEMEHRSGDVYGNCDCPYDGGACKHLGALLLFLRDEVEDETLESINLPANNLSGPRASSFDFDQYLEGLRADELRVLVRQFAPESYRRSLAAQHAAPGSNPKAVEGEIKKVHSLLKKIEGYYDPSDFESELIKRLEALRPYWLNEVARVLALLQECIKAIDEAQGEGYLYDDYSDGVFDGDDFGRYLAEFVAAQPAEITFETFSSISEEIRVCEYSSADRFLPCLAERLSEAKLRAIVPFFLKTDELATMEDHHQRVVWQYFQPVLSTLEKRKFLEALKGNPFFVLELAKLFEGEGEIELAIKTLENALPKEQQPRTMYFSHTAFQGKDKLFEYRIELGQRNRNSRELEYWVSRYVKEAASAGSLQFAITCLPGKQAVFENILLKINVEAFAEYLENQKRLDEVVQLFSLNPGAPALQTQYDFFKRHKKTYPGAAKAIFVHRLNEELPYTGDGHYRAVAEALVQLKAIEAHGDFQNRLDGIRSHYKRRSNLMEMLRRAKL